MPKLQDWMVLAKQMGQKFWNPFKKYANRPPNKHYVKMAISFGLPEFNRNLVTLQP